MRQHVMEEADAARQPTPGIPTANRLGGGATARGGRWQHEHAFQRAAWALRKRCVRVRQGPGPCLPQRGPWTVRQRAASIR